MADNAAIDPPPPPPDDVVATQPVTPIPPDAPPPRQGCMDKRSTLEKVLLVIIIIILIICLGFIAAFLAFYFLASPSAGTCLTEACVNSASRLKRYMDESVEPCNDFYQYACGGWIKSQVLDAHKTTVGLESIISDRIRLHIRGILEKNSTAGDPEYHKPPRIFYSACMDTAKHDERGKEPFLNLLKTIGKFPILDSSWNETDFNLETTIVNLAKVGIMPLISIYVARDLKSAARNFINIDDAQLALRSAQKYKDGRNNVYVKSYETWLVDNLVLLGVNRSDAEQDVKEVVDFAISLAKLMRDDRDKLKVESRYNLMTAAVLQSKYTWLKWLDVIQGLASYDGRPIPVYVDEQIMNTELDYLEKLGVLLSSTPKRVLANYLMSHIVTFTSYLGPKYVAQSDKYLKETQDVEPRPRFERCVDETTNSFPESVSRMYIDQYFSEDAKTYMNTMISDITESFSQLLDENTWMTDETKKKAFEKLKLMGAKVGYPDYIKDDERLNKLYTVIPNKKEEFMETVIFGRRLMVEEQFKGLREQRDKSRWPVHAAVVNAHYSALSNDIIFPAGFLQEPVYSPEYTSSMNYGAIGMIIGHEITHGYDNSGREFNAQGELKDWWLPKDSESYKSRTECFIDQYGCYKWGIHSLNGEQTLSENIADNGGLKQSYRAYRNLIKRIGSEELKLPGLKMNHNQIFFLSFAQVWCAKYREQKKEEMIKSEIHTPSPYRVIGTLQNSQEFADAFQCSQGSRMNPLRKCVLW